MCSQYDIKWLVDIWYPYLLNRISQDLAKDLAMLAREIHDVAGEIDSVSPAATDPGVVVLSKYLTVVDQQNKKKSKRGQSYTSNPLNKHISHNGGLQLMSTVVTDDE